MIQTILTSSFQLLFPAYNQGVAASAVSLIGECISDAFCETTSATAVDGVSPGEFDGGFHHVDSVSPSMLSG